MAQQMGIIRYSGKVGNVVGYVVNGRQMVRKAPESTGKAKSAEQIRQRERFSELTQLAKAANLWQKAYAQKLNYKASAHNNIVAYNRDYLHLEAADPTALRLPHTFANVTASLADVALTGRKLTMTLTLADNAQALAVVIAQGRAYSVIYDAGGAKELDIPLELKQGDTVAVLLQAGDATGLAPNTTYSVSVA